MSLLKKSLLAAAGTLLWAHSASAALVDCPTSFITDPTAKVESAAGATAVSACQYVSPPSNQVASIANINAAGFFGTSTWSANTGNLQVDTTNQSSGTWSITGANFASFDYIIVFKDGADTNLVAFLLNETVSSGNWFTPFTDPPFNLSGNATSKDVSHFTIAQRSSRPPQELPTPATLGLVGLALLGMGLARRRERNSDL